MDYPTPDDPRQSPVWENYVVAQACAAALGLVPSYAHALGVRVDRYDVTLVVQAPHDLSADADEDVVDIRGDLETLMGPEARVSVEVVPTSVPAPRPSRWSALVLRGPYLTCPTLGTTAS